MISSPHTTVRTSELAMLKYQLDTGVTGVPGSGSEPVTAEVIPANSASRLVTTSEVE